MLLISVALALPQASQARGWQDSPFTLYLTPESPDSTLLCWQDTELPVACPESVDVSHSTQVHAIEVDKDGNYSLETVFSYLFMEDVLADPALDPAILSHPVYGPIVPETLQKLPILILTDPLEVTTEERELAVEWIDPEGETSFVRGGARRIGYTSINYEKNSIRLVFREEYGASRWEVDLYGENATGAAPATSFDALTLRGGNHDSVFYLGAQGQHLRNFWMDESQLEMHHMAPHGRFAQLFLNGRYEGLYHIRERFNAAFMGDYLGGEEEDYEAINAGTAYDGTGEAWSKAVASAGDFQELKRWVDIDNFLDYIVLNFYAGNAWDWLPTHNWASAGPIVPDAGGFRFHSSDSDICLYYPYDVNILYLEGPSYLFGTLNRNGDADFKVALVDAIYRNLEDNGPLSAERAGERYARLASLAEDGIVAESARWGYGWWDRDEEWVTERDRLLNEFFPYRTEALWGQFKAAGWYPVGAPEVSLDSGEVEAGVVIGITGLEGAELWVTLNGEDPRVSGGAVSEAAESLNRVEISASMQLKARLKVGENWGPIVVRDYTIVEPVSMVLNEWNAVGEGEFIKEEDEVLGRIAGNGGDWLELVVLQDMPAESLALQLEDRRGQQRVELGVLPALKAGSLILVTEDFPENTSYNPEIGDWRLQLQAPLELSAWNQVVTLFIGSNLKAGPWGETDGVSDTEVGSNCEDPSSQPEFEGSSTSTFGLPNRCGDKVQDFSGLRSEGYVGGLDSEAPGVTQPYESTGCNAVSVVGWLWLLAVLGCRTQAQVQATRPVVGMDQDKDGFTEDEDCDDTDPMVNPAAFEVCGGGDENCNGLIDDEDPEVADPLAWYQDKDGDGFGGSVVYSCKVDELVSGGDCDDEDAEVYPGAPEFCDGVDRDCDGLGWDTLGSRPDCAVESCKALLEIWPEVPSGSYYLKLPSGSTAAVWCEEGWTLGMIRGSGSIESNLDFGAYEKTPDALGVEPATATAAHGWLDLNSFNWEELRVASYYGGVESYESVPIARSEFRIPFGTDGYLLYGGASGYVWCGGSAAFTDSGVGGVVPEGSPYLDCKGHGSLGSGWDFSDSIYANAGLTLCGTDASYWMSGSFGGTWISFGTGGAVQALWVR